MAERVLTRRELNRATLARQLLLERAPIPALDAVERLVGLQAQVAAPPYIGLWTRLREFRREDLTLLLERREVVRAPLMRSTLHLASAADYPWLRPALQPALDRALNAFFGKRARSLDVGRLIAPVRAWLEERPRTTGELRTLLSGIEPDQDPDALAYAVRNNLPLVQVPSSSAWGYGASPAYVTAERWLGRPVPDAEESVRRLVHRYLAAFGPASVRDVQAWAGMTGLKGAVEELKPELRAYRGERGVELLDLPDLPLPPADTPAPPRFVPEYDNLVLSHADRSRIVPEEYRPSIYLSAGRVRATFLVEGFVRGAWRTERAGKAAALVIEPFEPLPREANDALTEEGERLVRFIEEGAEEFVVRFAEEM